MPAARPFGVLIFSAFLFAGAAFGQSLPEGRIEPAEAQRQRHYATATFDMIVDYATPLPAPLPGHVTNPSPSLATQASLLADSLFEDAGYRVAETIESMTTRGFEPEQILDNDWERVRDVEKEPYKAVCQIETHWSTGTTTAGTAFIVGPRVLMTVAHNCWDDERDGWPDFISIVPARRGELGMPYGRANCISYIVPREWIESEGRDFGYDYAWLILNNEKLYGRVGYNLGLRAANDSDLSRFNLESCGYPDPYKRDYRMYRDYETESQIVTPQLFHHVHDILGGSSGCPLLVDFKRKHEVVGIQSTEPVDPPGPVDYEWNTAVRITRSIVETTNTYKKRYR